MQLTELIPIIKLILQLIPLISQLIQDAALSLSNSANLSNFQSLCNSFINSLTNLAYLTNQTHGA